MKEEILKAIKTLTDKLLISAIDTGSAYSVSLTEANEMSIKALQEQLDRLEGCEVCNDNEILDICTIDEYRYVSCGNDAGTHCDRNEYVLTIRSGNLPMIQVCQKDEQCADASILDYKIAYCPNCGRKLKGDW